MQNGIKSIINIKLIALILVILGIVLVIVGFVWNKTQADKESIEIVKNEDNTTTIISSGGEQTEPYEIFQLSMTDEDGGCCYGIKTPSGKLIMVDSGYQSDAASIRKFIEDNGGIVEAWFVTHPHFDHAGGIIQLLHEEQQRMIDQKEPLISIKTIYYAPFNESFFTTQAEGKDLEVLNNAILFHEFEALKSTPSTDNLWLNINYIPVERNDVIEIDSVKITCMNSFREDVYDVNANSLVLRMDMDQSSILFTGDITDMSIQNMLKEYPTESDVWDVDFIQIPHHGYLAGITNTTLYELTTPKVAFLDCSRNEYDTNAVQLQEQVKWLNHLEIPVVNRFEGINQILIQ